MKNVKKNEVGKRQLEGNGNSKVTQIYNKIVFGFLIPFMTFWANGFYCHAANIGENIGTWFLEQLWWIVIVVIAWICVMCYAKRNTVGIIIAIFIGAIILFVVREPEKLQSLGDALGNLFLAE